MGCKSEIVRIKNLEVTIKCNNFFWRILELLVQLNEWKIELYLHYSKEQVVIKFNKIPDNLAKAAAIDFKIRCYNLNK